MYKYIEFKGGRGATNPNKPPKKDPNPNKPTKKKK